MKQLTLISILVFCLAGTAQADLSFTQTLDFSDNDSTNNPYWGSGDSLTYGKWLVQGTTFSYTHDIRSLLDIDAGDFVTDAVLSLDFFDDDEGDKNAQQREWVNLSFDGSAPILLGGGGGSAEDDLDPGVVSRNITAFLDDGILNVTVDVFNNPGSGDIYLVSSFLEGTFAHHEGRDNGNNPDIPETPVPGAALLGMIGLSAAGVRLRRRA
jgi:hypothetical protein